MRALFASLFLVAFAAVAHAQQTPPHLTPTPVLVPPPAPHENAIAPLSIGLDVLGLQRTDPAFAAFGSGFSTAMQVNASFIVWEPARNFSLAPELSWRHEDHNSMLLQSAQTSQSVEVVSAGAILRWEPLRWLAPYVRATAGGEYFQSSVGQLRGNGVSFVSSFGGGLELDLAVGSGVTRRHGACDAAIALVVEGGIILGTANVITVASPNNPGELPADTISRVPVRLGTVDATAGYFRVGIAVRF